MSTHKNHTINYIEFPTTDIARTKDFYSNVFGWTFEDWGPEYISFSGAGISGGFIQSEAAAAGKNSPLVVIYSSDLTATEQAIKANGGEIVVPVFEFPGGRRFHFTDGAGSTLAVWSE